MKKPVLLLVGVVVLLLGVLFTLQGTDVIKGSAMSGSTFWEVGGPVVILIGLVVLGAGVRGRAR